MKYKILGKTRLKISQLGLGAVQICRIPEKDAIDLVRTSVDKGINLIDTAHDYPDSEELLGKALKGIRDKVVICTKSFSTDKDELIEDIKTSFKRLRTDYIDIFMFHHASEEKRLDSIIENDLVEVLLKEKEKGRIGFIAFSTHNPDVIDRYFEIVDFSVIMIPVNFISREFVDKKYKKLVDNAIGILGMKTLGGGRIMDIKTSFKFINQYKKVIPVVGMQNKKELEKNLKLINTIGPLDEDDNKSIKRIYAELGDKFCRGCGYCLPCSQGIDIPDINFLKVSFKQFRYEEVVNPDRD